MEQRSADGESGRTGVAKATAMVEARLRQQRYRTARGEDWPVTVGLRIRS